MATVSQMVQMAKNDVQEQLDAFKSAKVGGDGEAEGWGPGVGRSWDGLV